MGRISNTTGVEDSVRTQSAPSPRLSASRDGAVMVVRLDNAERHNAIDGSFWSEYLAHLDAAESDPTIRAVVTCASGRSWCSGADARLLARAEGLDDLFALVFGDYAAAHGIDMGRGTTVIVEKMAGYTKALIAAIDGAAIGAGLCLAMLHDVRIVSRTATLRAGFTDLGLSPELGVSQTMTALIGAERTFEILGTGRTVTGEEAAALGLALRAVEPGAALDEAMALARAFAARSPAAVAAIKSLVFGDRRELVARAEAEWRTLSALYARPEVRESVAALIAAMGTGRAGRVRRE